MNLSGITALLTELNNEFGLDRSLDSMNVVRGNDGRTLVGLTLATPDDLAELAAAIESPIGHGSFEAEDGKVVHFVSAHLLTETYSLNLTAHCAAGWVPHCPECAGSGFEDCADAMGEHMTRECEVCGGTGEAAA